MIIQLSIDNTYFSLSSVENVYVVVTIIYCWLGKNRGRKEDVCISLYMTGVGGLARALLMASCYWGILQQCGIFWRAGGRGGVCIKNFN